MFRTNRLGRYAKPACLCLVVAAGLIAGVAPSQGQQSGDAFANLPSSISLTGVVRDFRKFDVSGGHPDFEQYNTGHRVGLVQATLDADGKPVMANKRGQAVNTQYRDSGGRQIRPAIYSSAMGDIAGSVATASTDALTSAERFAQWFRNVNGVNLSKQHSITLTRQPGSNLYRFFLEDDLNTTPREGFFAADGDLYNDNDPTYNHNYHFTFELSTRFRYQRGAGQIFTFIGDDDVFVFINNKLAIDLGGVHSAIAQSVVLDRFADANGLVDGQSYDLKFFFAERHTTRSNARIETTISLENAQLPSTSALFD